MQEPYIVSYEDITLLVVFCAAYVVQMYIQYDDPQIQLRKADYIIGFFSSCIGGFIAYKATSFTNDNPGEVMFWTIFASVNSARFLKFIANFRVQDRLFNSLLNRFTNGKNTKDDI